MRHVLRRRLATHRVLAVMLPFVLAVFAEDQPQWGVRYSRNQVSRETNLPDSCDITTGKNVKWKASVGTESYALPVIAGGYVFIGANNGKPRDPRNRGDRGVLLCLKESDGSFCWQLVVPKLTGSVYLDWPKAGICSSPTVEGDRVYVVTNRAEIVCLDVRGQANGNDGPYKDEGWHAVPANDEPLEVTARDADILWLYDMRSEVGVHPHDAQHGSILLHGRYLYVNTSNGLNPKHTGVGNADAPSLVVLDKETGKLLAVDGQNIGPRIYHNTWSSPALATVNGKTLVFFCGGDGVVYAFKALDADKPPPATGKLERVWRFDPDPTSPKENVHEYIRNRKVSPSTIMGMPVFHDNRLYVAYGGDIWWGKREAWLTCIDVTKEGEDITETARQWRYTLKQHCCSTPAVTDELVFIADCGKIVHCVDAKTGRSHWTHEPRGHFWSSPLVADGKVYVGSRRGELLVFAASKEKRLIATSDMGDPISAAPVAANGVLYIATQRWLYALEAKAPVTTAR